MGATSGIFVPDRYAQGLTLWLSWGPQSPDCFLKECVAQLAKISTGGRHTVRGAQRDKNSFLLYSH